MCNGIICRHFIMPISKPAIEGVSFIEAENIPPELDSVNTDERKLLAFLFFICNPLQKLSNYQWYYTHKKNGEPSRSIWCSNLKDISDNRYINRYK